MEKVFFNLLCFYIKLLIHEVYNSIIDDLHALIFDVEIAYFFAAVELSASFDNQLFCLFAWGLFEIFICSFFQFTILFDWVGGDESRVNIHLPVSEEFFAEIVHFFKLLHVSVGISAVLLRHEVHHARVVG